MSELLEGAMVAEETAIPTPPAQPAAAAAKPKTKIRSIVVDTFTAFQKNQIMEKWDDNKKTTHDDWKDYGTEIVMFVKKLMDRGFNVVAILGYEGTGKSYGMKALPAKTNIWFNADDKESTYKGGKGEYGTRSAPTNYMLKPKSYEDVLTMVDRIIAKGNLDANPVAFLLAHIEDYKSGDKMRQRLKTLGKLTNKVNIEDMFTMCYYTEVVKEGEKVTYKLRTQNNGNDTCRSMEQQHEALYIPNNFQMIIDSIDAY